MKIMTIAEPQAGATLVQNIPAKDGDMLNLRHSG
jgi:hypothetical protein